MRHSPAPMCSRRWRGWRCARRRPARLAGSPCSTSCAPGRDGSTPSSCSGSRRARSRAAGAAPRSSTTSGAASSAPGSSAPTRSAATATSSTPPAPARPGASTSSARPRPTTARRSRRARSGRRPRRVFPPEDVERATSPAAALGSSPGRSRRRRPSASGCAPWRGSRRRRRAGRARARARRRQRLDAPPPARAARVPAATTRLRNPAVLAQLGGRTVFGATELERFVDCSSAWLFERVVDPKTIDAEADALLRGKIAHQALYTFYSGLPKELGSERVTPETLEPALALPRAVPRDALGSGVRLELGDVAGGRAATRASAATSCASSATRRESPLGFLPRRFEVGFGTDRSAPELQRGLELGDGLFVSGKIDRIDIDPCSARGIVQDYKSGKAVVLGRADRRRAAAPGAALHARAARPRGHRAARRRLPRALRRARARAACSAPRRATSCPASSRRDYLDEEEFWAPGRDGARERARDAARRIRAGDVAPRPEGRRVPRLVRPLDDVPGGRAHERRAARGRRGDAARSSSRPGPGTGKTSRARRAVRARGLRRGARRRVGPRHHLHAQGRRRAALAHPRRAASTAAGTTSRASSTARGSRRSTASARGSCAPTRSPVGIDPRFHELDEEHGAVLRGEAFERRSTAFCAAGERRSACACSPTTAAHRLRKMLTGVYETLRSAGRPLMLELGRAGRRRRAARRAPRGRRVPRSPIRARPRASAPRRAPRSTCRRTPSR